jgi:hypothetical protein
MKYTIKLIVFVIVVQIFCIIKTFAKPNISQQYQQGCGKGTVIVFGNGMRNEKKHAKSSLETLKKAFMQNYGKLLEPNDTENRIKFDIAYNSYEKYWFDALQVGRNYLNQWQLVDNISDLLWGSRWDTPSPWMSFLNDENEYYFLKDKDLVSQLIMYENYIHNGYRVIIVSHSQGNFYANNVSRFLFTFESSIANIQVATPATSMYNFTSRPSPWSTFMDDKVMKHVPLKLKPNIKGGASDSAVNQSNDIKGHSFEAAYMFVEESRDKIMRDIVNAGRMLSYPCKEVLFSGGVGTILKINQQEYQSTDWSESKRIEFYPKCGTTITFTVDSGDKLPNSAHLSIPKFANIWLQGCSNASTGIESDCYGQDKIGYANYIEYVGCKRQYYLNVPYNAMKPCKVDYDGSINTIWRVSIRYSDDYGNKFGLKDEYTFKYICRPEYFNK